MSIIKDSLSESVQKGLKFISQRTPVVEVKKVIEETVEDVVDEVEDAIVNNTPAILEPVEDSSYNEQDADDTAEGIVWLLDLVGQMLGRWLAKRKLKSKAEQIAGATAMQKLNAALYKIKKDATAPLDLEEQQLLELHAAVKDFTEELELSEFEQQTLQKPFAKLAKVKKIKLSPWQRVAIAGAMFYSTRIIAYREI